MAAAVPAALVAVDVLVTRAQRLVRLGAAANVQSRSARFRQTMMAVLGADVLLSLLHAPLVIPLLEVPGPAAARR